MTTLNENTPAAGQGNEGNEQIPNHSAGHLTLTATRARRRRPLTVHYVINKDDVAAGADDRYRALCGHTFAVSYGKTASSHPAEQAERTPCQSCAEMHRHQDDMRRAEREERALALGLKVLDAENREGDR